MDDEARERILERLRGADKLGTTKVLVETRDLKALVEQERKLGEELNYG